MMISFENKEFLMFLHFRVHPQMEHNWPEIISLSSECHGYILPTIYPETKVIATTEIQSYLLKAFVSDKLQKTMKRVNCQNIQLKNYTLTADISTFLGGCTTFLFPGKALRDMSTRALKLYGSCMDISDKTFLFS